jgi:feruloyl esterase
MQAALFVALFWTVVIVPVSHAATCESLSALVLQNTTITLAQIGPADTLVQPPGSLPIRQPLNSFKTLPGFCRIAATIKPTADSEIKIEVWLPLTGWNGRLLGVGNGAWAGAIIYGALGQSLRQGFAVVSTDTGHMGTFFDASFALGHPEKLIDFGYRSIHLMTVDAKLIVEAFYGKPARFAYFDGCSTGGMQGLSEAQRFPDDYNGIVDGDPANYFTHLMFGNIWPGLVMLRDPAGNIPPDKYPMINQAEMKACDALDGVVDGIINDPTRCHFDAKSLQCNGADSPECLTSHQVEALQQIYAGARNPRTGQQVFPGLEPGSPLNQALSVKPAKIPTSYFQYVLSRDPDWKWQTLNYDSDVTLADRMDGSSIDAIDPNLKRFKAHGGKLILYHGWSDALISPLNSINYYNSVVAKMGGPAKTEAFARLFMIPGMEHCGGGLGADDFDKISVLEQWVEDGVAPDKIIASHSKNGVVDMTRPLCPYPMTAQWKGTGSTSDAANFVCVKKK